MPARPPTGWSTRELAELAGTTVRTVRHYHALGLLDEPQRRHNGYKQYREPHLARLRAIRRLAELGVPLSRIGAVAAGSDGLRELDTRLAADLDRLRRTRSAIAAALHDGTVACAAPGFASVASGLSDADRSLVEVCARVYDARDVADLRRELALRRPVGRSGGTAPTGAAAGTP